MLLDPVGLEGSINICEQEVQPVSQHGWSPGGWRFGAWSRSFPEGLSADLGCSSWNGVPACFDHSIIVCMQVKLYPSILHVPLVQTPGGVYEDPWWSAFVRVSSCCRLSVDLFGHAKSTPLGQHNHLCHEGSHGEPFWLCLGERPDTSAGGRPVTSARERPVTYAGDDTKPYKFIKFGAMDVTKH